MEELIKTPPIQTSEGIPNRRYGLHTWVYYNNGYGMRSMGILCNGYIIIMGTL